MEVNPGYKQTEAGVIPEDWEVKPLGQIGEVRMCKRILKHQTRENGDVPFYKIGTFGGVADAFISQALFDEFRRKYSFPKKGDVLISAAGTIGRAVVYDGAPAYFQDSNIVWIENDESTTENAYLWYRYQVTKWAVSHGGTVARLYNDSLRTKIFVPVPSLPEQRAITETLSDVDGLLSGLDQLIAKKRDLKQAAMQQLLTGQTRLPGFCGEWDLTTFGDLAAIRNVKVIASSTPPGTRCVELESIGGDGTGRLLMAIDAIGQSSKYSFKKGDVLFGRLRAYLRKFWLAEFDGCCSTEIWPLVPRDSRLCGAFLYLLVQTESFVNSAGISYGTHMPRSDWSVLKGLPVRLPSVPEQTAIAAVLSDMDDELSALEARREKTRALKQAMMQELLTGRTRLV